MQLVTGAARDAFSLLLDAAPDAMVVVDGAGSVVMANARAADLFGFDREELIGQTVETLVPARYRHSHLKHRASYFHTPAVRPMGAGLELFGLRKDGSEFPVEISLSPVKTDAGPMAISAIRDITDRKRADEERVKLAREQAARAEAEQANRLKDEFLAMLAHELRNPLAAVNTGLAILNSIGGEEPEAVAAREIMGRQLRQLSRMVDDLLDVSRVSTGKIALHRQRVDVPELITRCIAALTANGRADDYEISVRTQPVVVDADSMRLEQVVMNLLTNALKYTPRGGSITVTARRDGGMAVIVVEDTGVGMTPDLLERVFELFVQGERTPARSEGGLGIGLTLVKRLVEMHGGTVDAASPGPSKGSRFTVRLPAATMSEPRSERSARVNAGGTSGPGRRIVVVEDNADVRDVLRMLLQLDGNEVHEAEDGHTGLQVVLDVRPDVAIIDIGLPGMDGYELVAAIRAGIGAVPPRLVALTGYSRAEDRHRMEQAGFDALLIKPVDPDILRQAVGAAPRVPNRLVR